MKWRKAEAFASCEIPICPSPGAGEGKIRLSKREDEEHLAMVVWYGEERRKGRRSESEA